MTTRKGFLDHGDDDPPRMTAGQKFDVVSGGRAAFFAAYPPAAAAGLAAALSAAMDSVPDSSSCFCCDFLNIDRTGGPPWCTVWKGSPPPSAINKGCDRFQDDGIPF